MIDKAILVYVNDIPFDRYITRAELCVKWNMPDRKVRDTISMIRKTAPRYVIISSSSKKGYKRPSTYAEVEKNISELDSRIKELSRAKKQLERLLKNKDQMGLGIAL
jgi:hypothetical protein